MMRFTLEPVDQVAGCGGGCIAAGIAAALGLPMGDLVAGVAGAFLGLAYTKPVHWGGWLDVPADATQWIAAYCWFRRIVTVAFILSATAVMMTAMAQVLPKVPPHWLFGWTENVNSKVLSLLLSSAGQYLIPRLLALAGKRLEAQGGKS